MATTVKIKQIIIGVGRTRWTQETDQGYLWGVFNTRDEAVKDAIELGHIVADEMPKPAKQAVELGIEVDASKVWEATKAVEALAAAAERAHAALDKIGKPSVVNNEVVDEIERQGRVHLGG